MRNRWILLLMLCLLLLSACQERQPACPPAVGTPRPTLALSELLSITADPGAAPDSDSVMIGGKMMQVDKIVAGTLCNDTWSGIVYVSCDAQVAGWNEEPLFLKGCSLDIAPGTVVYVAAHYDAAYYNGCSCHTGEQPGE